MNFAIKKKLSTNDIPIASLSFPDIRSSDVITMIDTSVYEQQNKKTSWQYITSMSDSNGNLIDASIFGKYIVTNEVYRDSFNNDTPLFYRHQLYNYYLNNRVEYKEYSVVLSNSQLIQLPVSIGKEIITSSVSCVYKEDLSDCPIQYVDYGRRLVRLSNSVTGIIIVRYSLIPIDITVSGDRLHIYRAEIIPRPESNYYVITLLSTSYASLTVTFSGYDRKSDKNMIITEYTTPSIIYENIDPDVFSGEQIDPANTWAIPAPLSRVVTGYPVPVVKEHNQLFYMRSLSTSDITKIGVILPESEQFSNEWNISFTKNSTIIDGKQYTTIPETLCRESELRKETISNCEGDIVSLSGQYPSFYKKSDGTIGGLVLLNNDREQTVLSISRDSRSIRLSERVGLNDILSLFYYNEMCVRDYFHSLNPTKSSCFNTYDARNSVMVIGLTESLNGNLSYPVVAFFPMYTELGLFISYSYQYVVSILNPESHEERIINRQRFIPLGTDEVCVDGCDVIWLGIVYTINPLTPESIQFRDMRKKGGGVTSRHVSCFDYSFYDGEATDASVKTDVIVKQSILNNYKDKLIAYDKDCILASNPEKTAHDKTRQYLNEVITKHVLPGSDVTIYEVEE